jgi:hypothetical protein
MTPSRSSPAHPAIATTPTSIVARSAVREVQGDRIGNPEEPRWLLR